MSTGHKDDTGKAPLTLLPLRALWQAALGMAHGAAKYGRHNYLGGLAYSRMADAAMRHIVQFMDGEDLDETGLNHLALAACEVLMLLETHLRMPSMDDRYKGEALEGEAPEDDGLVSCLDCVNRGAQSSLEDCAPRKTLCLKLGELKETLATRACVHYKRGGGRNA